MRIKKELEKFQTTFDEIAQLDKDTKEGFTEVNKVSKTLKSLTIPALNCVSQTCVSSSNDNSLVTFI